MNIGAAAHASGISAKMIRYYEETGLIAPVNRTSAGYRIYTDKDVHTLIFIRRARDMGFSIEQIGGLLALWQDQDRHSQDVKELAKAQLQSLEQRIQELQRMANTLRTLMRCCAGDERPDCPILEEMAGCQNHCK
jgi:Cu(I)-responsive transcriptional regulator